MVASESYNTGDTTFDAQISTLTAANADTMVLITFDEARWRYLLSRSEFRSWEEKVDQAESRELA